MSENRKLTEVLKCIRLFFNKDKLRRVQCGLAVKDENWEDFTGNINTVEDIDSIPEEVLVPLTKEFKKILFRIYNEQQKHSRLKEIEDMSDKIEVMKLEIEDIDRKLQMKGDNNENV